MKTIPLPNLVWRTLAGAAAAVILTLCSGCFLAAVGVAAGAGAGTVAYIKGELTATLPHHVGRVTDATEQAIAQMQFAKISEKRDALSANIIVRTAEDKKVEINLTRQADDTTKVDIRVGLMGDEALSRAVLEHIKSNL